MTKDRPTFSEHWYRVAGLRPGLMPSVMVRKQFYRGQDWMLLQSALNAEYFRLHVAAYGFIALLDGRRTVAEAWELANRRHGDAAPTQGEAIQLMGRLYQANLLQADLPPDSTELFKRFQQRRGREMRHTASSILFPKFPLFDPNLILGRWLPLFAWLFGPAGAVFFALSVLAGLGALAGRQEELWDSASGILSAGNLIWLYLAFLFSKGVHELGSAFACKRFGRLEGDAGQVRQAGIMLLLLAPAPYIDTSGAWGLRRKSYRVLATSAGILSEFSLAALAALVWANSPAGSAVHALAYNLMFVAGVSTFLFNGNPLLRFDAYYILCDLCETPNLAGRSQQYLYYLVKRHVWKLGQAVSPAHSEGERILFTVYGLAAGLYRVFLVFMILLTVAELAFFIGVILALVFAVVWFVFPFGKLTRYLLISGELARVRNRAIGSTAAALALVLGFLLFLPLPDRFRLEGVAVVPTALRIFARTEGTIESIRPNLSLIEAGGQVLLRLDNPWTRAELAKLQARQREYQARLGDALAREPAEAQSWRDRLAALEVEIRRVEGQVAAQLVKAPRPGLWFCPDPENVPGRFIRQGQLIGQLIAGPESSPGPDQGLAIRAKMSQDQAAALLSGVGPRVEIRVKGRPDLEFQGEIISFHPAGKKELPTPAMGIPAGGETQVESGDREGLTSQEHFFEIEVRPSPGPDLTLRQGQMLVLRFSSSPKSAWRQGQRALRQMFQRRFQV